MIAPVCEQNAVGRTVYLPEEMKLLRFHGQEVTEERVLPAGHHFLEIPLEEVVLFIRKAAFFRWLQEEKTWSRWTGTS